MFFRYAGLNLTNSTLPETWGPEDSKYVGYSLIYGESVLKPTSESELRPTFGSEVRPTPL